MHCPTCQDRIEHGSRQCRTCGTEIDTGTTDEMTSLYPQPVTGRLEYAFILPGKQAARDRTSRPDPGPVPLGVAVPASPTTAPCRRCRADLSTAARFCPACGTSTQTDGLTRLRRKISLAADNSRQKLAASVTGFGFSRTDWIVFGVTGFCLFAAVTGIFPTVAARESTDSAVRMLGHLHRIEWLLMAVLAATLGRYFKRE